MDPYKKEPGLFTLSAHILEGLSPGGRDAEDKECGTPLAFRIPDDAERGTSCGACPSTEGLHFVSAAARRKRDLADGLGSE